MATKRKMTSRAKAFVKRCISKLKKANVRMAAAANVCGSLAPTKKRGKTRAQYLIWDPNLPHYGGKGKGGWIPVAELTYKEHHGKKKIVRRKALARHR